MGEIIEKLELTQLSQSVDQSVATLEREKLMSSEEIEF